MKIRYFKELTKDEISRLLQRKFYEDVDVEERVKSIVEYVRTKGDEAIINLEKEYDKCDLTKVGFYVQEDEFNQVEEEISNELREALDLAIDNVSNFHLSQLSPNIYFIQNAYGIIAGEKWTPIDSVGLYVPRGKGTFPSVAIMLAVPAKIAGVKKITLVTPPDPNGNVDPAVLYVCKKLDIKNVLRIGGAQAIAALAFGTESVEKVSKVVGPGSKYVNVAKKLLAKYVDIGILAGPSESAIIADKNQNPKNVALDLMNEAEHGPDSISLLLTDSKELADKVNLEIENYLRVIEEPRKSYIIEVLNNIGGAIIFENLEAAIDFCNEFAPEHLVLDVNNPFSFLDKIKNTGEILIGPNTPISAANYIAGPNSILPTSGFAKSMSALSVRDFQKRSSIIYVTNEGLNKYKRHIELLAKYEGFYAHALSALDRVIVEDLKFDDEGVYILHINENDISLIRKTRESQIIVNLNKGERDLNLKKKINTSLNFLNHMIETISWRSGFNISIDVSLENAYKLTHVIAEDSGITIGRAFYELLKRNYFKGINGNGFGISVLDEAKAEVIVSFEGRPYLKIKHLAKEKFERVEDMLTVDLQNFLSGFSNGAKCTLHVNIKEGEDPHHIWESVFRALGEALKMCFERNEFRKGTTVGVKGI